MTISIWARTPRRLKLLNRLARWPYVGIVFRSLAWRFGYIETRFALTEPWHREPIRKHRRWPA